MEISSLILKLSIFWYGICSLFLFILYGMDKKQAIIGGRRIPEKVLHITSLFGGFPGGLLGRSLFRHKTRKPMFIIVLLFSLLIHVSGWIVYFYSR